ncbi:MAG TPA: type II toxin-antitoxin system prevent-host-death family antitoxin [Candidatus Kryptonia bacterium]|nr:type II toxin-antitoxin system prevent-host-death family antitoxin [Candidatus Kryptonia bacterium]
MAQRVSLREANQHLSRYVQAVEKGDEVVITRRGQPVARLVRAGTSRALSREQTAALRRTLARMRRGYSLGGRAPARDGLHER